MNDFFSKLKRGKNKVNKFKEENARARQNLPLPLMILNDALPLLTVIAYLLMGLLAHLWHPGWIIFFIIPIYYCIGSCIKHKEPALFPMAFIVVAAYLLIGFLSGMWHPFWAIFVLVPVYYAVAGAIKNKSLAKIFDIVVPLLIVAVFLVLGLVGNWWHPGWVVFLAIPLYYQLKSTTEKYKRIHSSDVKQDDTSDGESVDGEID